MDDADPDRVVRSRSAVGPVAGFGHRSIHLHALLRRPRERGVPARRYPTLRAASWVVSTTHEQNIALFFTGRQHAGENLPDVLKRRAAEFSPPI